MKILLAFDSYKGCMTAEEACRSAAEGVREVMPYAEIVELPLSDGGEGLVKCVSRLKRLEIVTIDAHDALMRPLKVEYALDGGTAYMEMSATCGLPLIEVERRDAMATTTYGVGEMVIDAVVNRKCKKIVMGIGGSATTDGGKGMIECLRAKGALRADYKLASSDLAECEMLVACDVVNPLYGENGAAFVYAPQKGATKEQVVKLDARLRDFARWTQRMIGSDAELVNTPGAGAAGGLGYGLMAYMNAKLLSGIDLLLEIADYEREIYDADLIVTGEGKSDRQTLMGKVPHGVLRHSKDKRVVVLSGCIEDGEALLDAGFAQVLSINEGDTRPLSQLMMKEVAMENMKRTMRTLLL